MILLSEVQNLSLTLEGATTVSHWHIDKKIDPYISDDT